MIETPVFVDFQSLAVDDDALATEMWSLIEDLFPICRSITGNGVRQTLARVADVIAMEVREVASGTVVNDWVVPDEWTIRDAYVKNSQGERVIDFNKSNLHLVSYSNPVRCKMSLQALKPHLHSLPEQPDVIPYRTAYYDDSWGFCLTQRALEALEDDEYDVVIDASLAPGSLTYGEVFLAGESEHEVLISTHVCHPSLANDNLSGIAVAAYLARLLSETHHHYSYRFVFIPGTIGAITWLAENGPRLARIKHGLVLTGLGDKGGFTYKRSRHGTAAIDRASILALREAPGAKAIDFSPYGYDERQYCSPGYDLPVGRLSRSPHGEFREYHTSLDNLEFIHAAQIVESLRCSLTILETLEGDQYFKNLKPNGEPHLSKYGLYDNLGGEAVSSQQKMAMLWVLNLSDGSHSLLDIAERAGLSFRDVAVAADRLVAASLLDPLDDKATLK